MKLHLSPTHFLLAASCVCQALAISPLAHCQNATATAQDTPTSTQQGQNAQPAPQTPASNSAPAKSEPDVRVTVTREMTYREFISEVGGEDLGIQQATELGKKPSRSRRHFSKFLGIREDDEQIIHAIVLEAAQRLKANEDKFSTDFQEVYRHGYGAEQDAKADALEKVRNQNDEGIVGEVMLKLKQQLTEDDFKTLDTYVYRLEGDGTEIIYQRHPNHPKHHNSSVNPAPEKPQGVQP